jgi:hypothetical protein
MFNWKAAGIVTLVVLGMIAVAFVLFGALAVLDELLGLPWALVVYFLGCAGVGVIIFGFITKRKQPSPQLQHGEER